MYFLESFIALGKIWPGETKLQLVSRRAAAFVTMARIGQSKTSNALCLFTFRWNSRLTREERGVAIPSVFLQISRQPVGICLCGQCIFLGGPVLHPMVVTERHAIPTDKSILVHLMCLVWHQEGHPTSKNKSHQHSNWVETLVRVNIQLGEQSYSCGAWKQRH